jgi:aminoglycoside phosphotransferase (APT) family kinase protein
VARHHPRAEGATPPPAEGVRLDWLDVPGHVRAAVEQRLGSPVARAVSQRAGFSPGVAARLRLADARGVFVKAVASEPNPTSPAFHRREARVAEALPASAPAPRLLFHYDEGEPGWVVLVFEEAPGQLPTQPWRPDELERVLAALEALAAALTPSPLPTAVAGPAGEMFARTICGWKRLRDEQPALVSALDDWSRRHLDALVALEAQAPDAVQGETLLHFDVRADNVLLSPEQVWFVDWPHACVGAAWVDCLLFAPSVTMQGGPPPEQILARHRAAAAAHPAALTAVTAAMAGFFTYHSLQPAPPGLPTLRPFQAAQGSVAREWAARRMGSNAS